MKRKDGGAREAEEKKERNAGRLKREEDYEDKEIKGGQLGEECKEMK